MKKVLALLTAVVCLFLTGSAASARVIRVSYAGAAAGPGDTWATSYRYISQALAAAVSGDEVWVKGGTFQEAITIPSGVALYGGFAGTETLLSQRPPFPRVPQTANDTWISGTHGNNRLVTIPNGAISSTRLDGFTVYGCDRGGVAVGTSSSPVITNCVIGNCSTPMGGGIDVADNATPLITKNEISGCEAHYGGGICVAKSAPIITNNVFQDNTATCAMYDGDGVGVGGAIYLIWCGDLTPLIANNRMHGNEAYHQGGAIYCYDSNPIITGNVMYLNYAYDENHYYLSEQGGAIYCMESSPVINQNTMCWNGANRGGGAICFDPSSSATMYGNIIYYNTAYQGHGWNIYNRAAYGAVVSDYNDLICDFDEGIYGFALGSHDITVEPGFVNNYYLTPNIQLASGSPCVDAGYPGAVGLQSVDALGNPRVVGPRPDMGGYEYQMQITALANDTPVWQTAIPGLYWFQVLNGKWAAVGIAPTVDHDIRAADNVWMNPVYAYSAYGGSTRDFIVANGQSLGDATHYAQVYYGEMGTYLIEADWSAVNVAVGGSTNASVTAGEVVDVFQSTLLSGKTYQISVHITSGSPDLSLFVFAPSKTTATRYTADWASRSGAAGVDEQMYAIAAESGTYGIVVVNEDTTPGSYTVSVTEKAPVTISGHIANFAGANMARIGVQANNLGGSDTTDLSGDYTLTVPYYWTGSVSPVRTGWAFAPASIAYTNLIANAAGANFTGGQTTSVGGTKLLPDSRSVYLADKPVTATFGSDAYIEDGDRAGAIRVVGGATTSTSVTLGGVLSTANGERRVTSPVILSSGTSTVAPVYLANKSIGGANVNYAPGIPGTTGLNNVGLLVRTSGVVTGISGNIFYVNDGSGVVDVPGALGIRVDTGGLFPTPPVGKQVTVTGISGVWMNGSNPVRSLLPRSATDVQRVYGIALVHGASTTSAAEIHDLAELRGIDTTLIPDSQVTSATFAPFDAVLISNDSLVYQSSQAVTKIANAGLPVMGIGTGGSRYFEARGLYIGWSHSSTTTGPSTIVPRVAASPMFHSPYEVYASTITPYGSDLSGVLVYMPNAVTGVTRLASPPDPAGSYYVLCSQSRCLLWGYSNGAHLLTSSGKNLFVNAIYYTLGL